MPSRGASAQAVFDVDQFVADCLDAVRREGRSAGSAIKEVLERAVSDPARIEEAVGPARVSPLLSTWHHSAELTVVHLIWPPEVDMFAHDHRMWAAIGLYGGRELNRFYRPVGDGTLEVRNDRTLQRGDAALLGEQTVHAVANPTREWTAAIHVYGGDFFAPGRRMWLEPDQPPIEYDSARVVRTLEEAAQQAMT